MIATRAPVAAWTGLQWPGETVVVMGSGESFSDAQAEQVRRWRDTGPGRRTLAINTTFRRAPWADVLYGCDAPWWEMHINEVRRVFRGELWTQDEKARRHDGMRWIASDRAPGLSKRPGTINQGANGGYQAVGLAVQAGATRIVLLGFDMHGGHWHGPHPLPLTNPPKFMFPTWIKNFERMAPDLVAAGIEVVNCSPGSALTCFKNADLKDALACSQ